MNTKMDKAEMDWIEWIDKIPYLNFPAHWKIKMVPPFAGAVVRFFVRIETMNVDDRLSIYLDCHNQLGSWDGPYWEVYPVNGDTARCRIEESEKLIHYIEEGLKAFI